MNLTDTVAILTPTTTGDRYGNPTLSYPSTGTDSPAWVGGQTTSESTADGDRTLQTLACVLPADVVVTAQSRIRWRGDDYEIQGDPLPMSRRGVLHHYEMTLRRVEG